MKKDNGVFIKTNKLQLFVITENRLVNDGFGVKLTNRFFLKRQIYVF